MRTLDIGCGAVRDPSADAGMDFYPYQGVDIVHDATRFPWPIRDEAFDRLVSHQLVEHLPARDAVAGRDIFFEFFDEAWRILKPGGTFAFDTPHKDNPLAYGDVTHRRFWQEFAFSHLWDPARDPLYPRRIWELVSINITRWYGVGWFNTYHVRRYLPRLDRFLCRHRIGSARMIFIVLRKPPSPQTRGTAEPTGTATAR